MARRRRGTPMKLSRRKWLHLAAGAAALPALSRVARAQAYPTRQITLVAPFPAGGPVDTIARILAEHIRGSLGHVWTAPGWQGLFSRFAALVGAAMCSAF